MNNHRLSVCMVNSCGHFREPPSHSIAQIPFSVVRRSRRVFHASGKAASSFAMVAASAPLSAAALLIDCRHAAWLISLRAYKTPDDMGQARTGSSGVLSSACRECRDPSRRAWAWSERVWPRRGGGGRLGDRRGNGMPALDR